MADLPRLQFLSWARSGVASGITTSPSAPRAAGEVSLQVRATGGETPRPGEARTFSYEIRGPADVIGLQPAAVRRAWPASGDTTAAENLFPLVEFHADDLPWRYSPEAPQPATAGNPALGGRLHPWLCLLALREDWVGREQEAAPDNQPEGVMGSSPDPNKGLPPKVTLRAGTPLPDLEHAWAWAHVERLVELVAGADVPIDGTALARVLCTRKLKPRTRYLAVLVPTYESGRRVGLGLGLDGLPGGASRAWQTSGPLTAPLDLPAYHHWRFQTGEAGDVEKIARALELAPALPAGAGALCLRVDIGLSQGPAQLDMETALGEASEPAGLRRPGLLDRAALVEALGLDGADFDPETGDPLVHGPLYGQAHRQKRRPVGRHSGVEAGDALLDPSDTDDWFHQLNTDARWRVAAGLGAECVRRHQEALMEEAWSWLSMNRAAVARAQLRAEVQHSWRKRAVKPPLDRALAAGGQTPDLARVAPLVRVSLLESSGTPAHPLAEAQLRRTLRPGSRAGEALGRRPADRPALAALAENIRDKVKDPPARSRLSLGSGTAPVAARGLLTNPLPTNPVIQKLVSQTQIERESPPPMPAPKIDLPTSTLLRELSVDWLLAGAAALEDNRIYFVRPNGSFIEAVLAGMNHEISREFLWREFPTDGRGTVFAHFWESLEATSSPDIQDQARWSGRLGGHGQTPEPPLVLLLKTPLLRRFPGLMLFLGRFSVVADELELVAGTSTPPIFHGALGPDTSFFGFTRPGDWPETREEIQNSDWYYVLQQQPGAPVFGLDLDANAEPRGPDDLNWPLFGAPAFLTPTSSKLGLSGESLDGPITAASFARCTVQRPVQIFIAARGGARG